MTEPNFYAIIPANVRYDTQISSTAKLLYAEISSLTNSKGFCFASNEYFANLYGISIRQVRNLIGKLEERCYITVERETSQRKIFIFEAVTVKKISSEEEKNFLPEGEKNFPHNNTSINNKSNNPPLSPQGEKVSAKKLIAGYTTNSSLREAIVDFAKMRKSIKKPLTERALKMVFKKLDTLAPGDDVLKIKILNRSTFRCWQDLYALDEKQPSSHSDAEPDAEYQERLRRFEDGY